MPPGHGAGVGWLMTRPAFECAQGRMSSQDPSGSGSCCLRARLRPRGSAHREERERRCTEMRTYERPTLTPMGSFGKVTGGRAVKRTRAPDILHRHRLIG
ncbi:keywimysin-related RiPP [Streptomyces sp. ISL-99]|uniref:keywimysin-related RiPP n=1 Tax=Streptomyces sp. ISL-99 TaxID=2819193 RepID=UPI0035B41F11